MHKETFGDKNKLSRVKNASKYDLKTCHPLNNAFRNSNTNIILGCESIKLLLHLNVLHCVTSWFYHILETSVSERW